jgi:hypothetical protein
MSQAEALLANLTEDVIIHEHPVTDPDGYFLIDPDTRIITAVGVERNYVMQYDHNSERYTFELPRYVEGHDMIRCNRVRVHYNNIDSKSKREFASVGELTDLAVNLEDPSTVTCSWLIPRDATQYAGILSFLIQFMCVADDGTIVYEWHTDIYGDVDVKPSRNNGEQAIASYNDILEDWYQRLFNSKDSVVADIERYAENKLAETLKSIPDDYTTLYNTTRDASRTRANAIECNAVDSTVVITDASDDYLRSLSVFGKTIQNGSPSPTTPVPLVNVSETGNVNVRIFGKNLLDVPNIFTYSSVKEFKVNLPVGTYILSWKKATKGSTNLPCFRCMVNDRWYELATNGKSIAIVLDKPETTIYIYSNGSNASASVGVTSTIEDLMFSYDGGTYEPFKPMQSISVNPNKPLRGIPVESDGNYTDSTGQQWVCDEIDLERGVYVQRIQTINVTEFKGFSTRDNGVTYCISYPAGIKPYTMVLSSSYIGCMWSTSDLGIYNTGTALVINDNRFTSLEVANSIIASEKPEVYYILEKPIETPLTEDEIVQFEVAHSNSLGTTVFNDIGANMKVGYNADTKAHLYTILGVIENGAY